VNLWPHDSTVVDHGRVDWLGCWVEFEQKAHLKKIGLFTSTYLRRVYTPCLSVSTGIYGIVKVSKATLINCRKLF